MVVRKLKVELERNDDGATRTDRECAGSADESKFMSYHHGEV